MSRDAMAGGDAGGAGPMRAINTFAILTILAATIGACAHADSGEDVGDPESIDTEQQAATEVVKWKSNWKGASANAWISSETGGGSVDAWEGRDGSTKTANLSYHFWSHDPTSWKCRLQEVCMPPFPPGPPPGSGDAGPPGEPGEPVCYQVEYCDYTRSTWSSGWGQIHPKDFKANGTSAGLSVDVSKYPGFYADTCTMDWETWAISCAPSAPSGTIQLAWRKDGRYSYSQSGVSRQEWGPYSVRTTGSSRSFSAAVTGTLLGVEFTGGGYVSTNNGASMSRDIVVTPKP